LTLKQLKYGDNANAQQPHTLPSRTSRHTSQNLAKSVSALPHNGQTTKTKEEHRTDNITYTQAGVSCFVGQESAKFKVQFFVESSVVKIPACV